MAAKRKRKRSRLNGFFENKEWRKKDENGVVYRENECKENSLHVSFILLENVLKYVFMLFLQDDSIRGWVYWGGRVRGVHTPLALARWGAGGGGCYFEDKAGKYERHNEIHVIVMICHTVAEYHV